MNESDLLPIVYKEVVQQIRNLYGVKPEQEHAFIHEFFEGPLPLFKLILVSSDSGPGFIMVSFHIEVEASDAIQWFARVRALDPNVRVTACYLRDSHGTSYVGEDAHILRLYMIEQDVISNYIKGDKDPEEIVNRQVTAAKPSPLKTYSDYKVAINEFNKLTKKDGDIEH